MTDNPAFVPDAQPADEELTLHPGIALLALVVAPFGSALAIAAVHVAYDLLHGYRANVALGDVLMAFPIAILFFVVGGPLVAFHWWRTPFGLLPCAIFGAVCGGIVYYLYGLGLRDLDTYAYFEREGLLFDYYLGWVLLVLWGVIAGLAGGLTFWKICRVGARRAI